MSRSAALLAIVANLLCLNSVSADDWPMWRYDANRSAASQEQLPSELNPLWSRTFSPRKQAWDDPLNHDLMTYDRVFEPIVAGGRMFVGFNDQDKLIAMDIKTGKTLWTAFAEAPIRFAPVAYAGNVYCVSDDGYLYCWSQDTGKQQWRFRGGPSDRKALGNQRITSAWPARGGPVVRDGHVYFAASIWPFMGTFIYSLDAKTGDVVWVNDSTGAQYIKQPHSAPSFAGVAPQGSMVATEKYLVVPGGRSVPAVLDRATGKLKYFEINAGGKGNGGATVFANDERFFLHTRLKGTRAFNLKNGKKTAFLTNEPVLCGEVGYSAVTKKEKHLILALRVNLADQPKKKKPKKIVKQIVDALENAGSIEPVEELEEVEARDKDNPDPHLIWEVEADGTGDLIRVGDELIAAGEEGIVRIGPLGNTVPKLTGKIACNFKPERLLAANGMLFAVSLNGEIAAFADHSEPAVEHVESQTVRGDGATGVIQQEAKQLADAGDADGFALWFGVDDDPDFAVIDKLSDSFVQVAVVDNDAQQIQQLRAWFDTRGRYGRVTGHVATPLQFLAPQYIANMVFVGSSQTESIANDKAQLRSLFSSVRPYGGVLQLLADPSEQKRIATSIRSMNLPQAEVSTTDIAVVVKRVGRIPGSDDWTHQYGDIANTVKSDDSSVELPLGVLWFGGTSNADILPRHGHGPPEQVIGGRLFIQGLNSLSARDVYTGRALWKREFKDLGTYDVYYDDTYKDTPLDPKYNQNHIPGANARGTNFVAAADRIYIVEGPTCHVLDPATGKNLLDISIPQDNPDQPKEWGFIGVYEDVLIGGVGFANYRQQHKLTFLTDKVLKGNARGFGSKSFDRAASTALVGFDRHTGKQLWRTDAVHSFWHNGITAGEGKIFCLDKNPHAIEKALARRGKAKPKTYRLLAIDHQTGKKVWEHTKYTFGTWLSYDAATGSLLQAGARAKDRSLAEASKGMAVYKAADGSVVWHKPELKYNGPCILHGDYILTNANSYSDSAGAFRISDGEQMLVTHPVTGKQQPWKMTRAYGCNNIIACENFLTFRSGAAGFYDLKTNSGTGNLGGFKSGCTSNLVVANGVLNAPDYTRTCSCAYQNQTSLALVHMPEIDMWSVNYDASVQVNKTRIEHIGLNFGAPGDRRDKDGTLWLEYPDVAGDSPPLYLEFEGQPKYIQQHPSTMQQTQLPWVNASGVTNFTRLRIHMRMEEPLDLSKNGIPITHKNDDAEQRPTGIVNVTSADLEMVRSGKEDRLVGLRFNKIPLKRGAKIKSARIQFTADEKTKGEAALRIGLQDSVNAAAFRKKKRNISDRKLLDKQITWKPADWTKTGVAKVDQRTPNLAPLLQKIVDRDDWKPGNAVAFVVSGSGKRVAVAGESRDKPGARLLIDADDVVKLSTPLRKKRYRVNLLFAALRDTSACDFDVIANGKLVAENLRLSATADRTTSADFEIDLSDTLDIAFKSRTGQPVLSGISIRTIANQ